VKFHGGVLQDFGMSLYMIYMGVDLDAVWQITQKEIPKLEKQIKNIIKDFSL
jgi:uncharacterized protein with HEPN domain